MADRVPTRFDVAGTPDARSPTASSPRSRPRRRGEVEVAGQHRLDACCRHFRLAGELIDKATQDHGIGRGNCILYYRRRPLPAALAGKTSPAWSSSPNDASLNSPATCAGPEDALPTSSPRTRPGCPVNLTLHSRAPQVEQMQRGSYDNDVDSRKQRGGRDRDWWQRVAQLKTVQEFHRSA